MCTAVSFQTKDHYFGRNLDLERSYDERVVITPRGYTFRLRRGSELKTDYAMIGMATVQADYPLYYEATNEAGLSIAGLNFPGNAVYHPFDAEKDNITPFELTPWILGQCGSLNEAKELIKKLNLYKEDFSRELPLSPLHWMISDRSGSLVLESMADGLHAHDNPIGVLTNNPPFEFHRLNLNRYLSLHEGAAENRLAPALSLCSDSLGMGAFGLPGDYSSSSRFIKAAFVMLKSRCDVDEKESVSQFFHILNSVAMPKGCVLASDGEYEYTRYSCCCNTDHGIYYYKTYNNSTVTAIDLHQTMRSDNELTVIPLAE